MKHNSFVVFILSHGRASNVKTLRTLKRAGYTGKVIIVIDNEDVARRYDAMDNFDERRTIFYARNACFEIAEKLGYEYF